MKLKQIKRVKVADLREWDRNPRKIDDTKFSNLVERINGWRTMRQYIPERIGELYKSETK